MKKTKVNTIDFYFSGNVKKNHSVVYLFGTMLYF